MVTFFFFSHGYDGAWAVAYMENNELLNVKKASYFLAYNSESPDDSLNNMNVILFPILIELRFFPRERTTKDFNQNLNTSYGK